MEAQNKRQKNCFTQNLSCPTFFEIFTSNFQKIFLAVFKNSFITKLKKNKPIEVNDFDRQYLNCFFEFLKSVKSNL